MPIHQAGDVLTDCCCHWYSDYGSVPHTTLLQKIFYYPFKYLSPRFPGSSLCKELRGILGVCSRKGENDDAIFQKPPMNVYNLFISKSVLLKPIWSLLLTPFPSLNQPFLLFYFSPSFYFFLQKSCDILCIFKQLIRVLLCFYSRDYEYLSSSMLFSLSLFEKELLPKETIFL